MTVRPVNSGRLDQPVGEWRRVGLAEARVGYTFLTEESRRSGHYVIQGRYGGSCVGHGTGRGNVGHLGLAHSHGQPGHQLQWVFSRRGHKYI